MSKARLEQLAELRRRFDAIFQADPFEDSAANRKAQEEIERLAADIHTRGARRWLPR